MLTKPSGCNGCPLLEIGAGFMEPALSTSPDRYKVALIGEALGKDEAEAGKPFVGKAGFKLTRLIEWAGLDRQKFDIFNTVWCRPPDNKLEGTSYERHAISHCQDHHWASLLNRSRVLVPMGNVPLAAFTGRKGILSQRGYVQPGPESTHLVPTVHPSFIQRGQSKYSAAFIHDIQKAVELAANGLQVECSDYTLDPTPGVAYEWAKRYRDLLQQSRREGLLAATDQAGSRTAVRYLAYDIETPGKVEDEAELDPDDDPTYTIWRIGFSYAPNQALSIPWEPAYIPAIKLLMESDGEKVVWNGEFDNPRIRHNGVKINGLVHDGMVAWHVLHSDLPKGLGFVATFTCPYQPAWKHLSHARPAFYNATDADVELRSMLVIEEELRRTGLWEVYQRDVVDLDPILRFMSEKGMPLDLKVREEKALILAEKQASVLAMLEAAVPLAARRIDHVYVNTPAVLDGLLSRGSTRTVRCCDRCGLHKPTKPHFRHLKKRPNPCDGAGIVEKQIEVTEYYRLAVFKPSREQLIAYQRTLGRRVPMTKDKKTGLLKPTMDEKAIKGLILSFPSDPFYGMILEYRELDKLAGTYIGRPVCTEALDTSIHQ